MKRILLLFTTTGYNAQDFIEAARKLNIKVIPGTDRCDVLDDPWKDGALPLRFTRPSEAAQKIMDYARNHPIDAIISVGDSTTIAGALATRKLRLIGNSPESVKSCHSKLLSRKILKKAGLPVPRFRSILLSQDAKKLSKSINFPCVLKPLSLSTSQGVIRANDCTSFVKAFHRVQKLLQLPRIQKYQPFDLDQILVEDYLDGQEFALEGLLNNGKLKTLALFDKPDPLQGPFFEETIYTTPSRLPTRLQKELLSCCQKASQALGLTDGPIHAELRLNREGPWIIEIAPRTIGGLCSRALRFGIGMSLEEIHIRHKFKMPIPSLKLKDRSAGVMMLPIKRKGILRRVSGLKQALSIQGIVDVTVTAKKGQLLIPPPEGDSYLGFLFARGSSSEKVEKTLKTAHQQLSFDVYPEVPVLSS